MKRYELYYLNDFGDDCPARSREADDGEWVNYEEAADRIYKLEQALHLVNDKHGAILEASVHDAVLACLGLKAHPNGTAYGYQFSGDGKP